jgi:hypothetical protein
MSSDLHSFALKNTLDEIRNLCPDITSAFMFREDGEITAADENTPEKTIVRIINAFEGVLEKAEAMGGIELITIEGSKGGVNVSHVNDHYFVTVTPESADKNYVNTISRVLVSTVLKLVDKISPAPLKNNPPETVAGPEASVKNEEDLAEQPREEPETEDSNQSVKPEPTYPEPEASQLMVEDLKGLLVGADTARVDKEILQQWQELYEHGRIEEVEIETFGGQSARCKIKPIKDSDREGKGIVQIPQKIQRALEVKKGELVKVRPIVVQGNET